MTAQFSGGAWMNGELVTWGKELRQGTRVLKPISASIGCVLLGGVAMQSGTDLVWWSDGKIFRIDTNAAAVDMAEIEIFGRRGLMVIHHGMQLRFYEKPADLQERWQYSEIYSFYTASEQGGLIQRDVDGDGKPDLICGNYWVQSPDQFELHWQLFAINLFHDHPVAASARLAWRKGKLLWLESKRPNARAVWFTPHSNPKEQWIPEPLGLALHFPRALLVKDDLVWIGENNGKQSRLIEWPGGKVIHSGVPLHTLIATKEGVIGIGPESILRF